MLPGCIFVLISGSNLLIVKTLKAMSSGTGLCSSTILIGLLLLAKGTCGSRRFRTDFLQDIPTPSTSGPIFDPSTPSNLTTLAGNIAFLHCKVKNLGNRTVSWVRHRDIHLLTAGRYTYTSDQRFEALHTPHTEEWTLRIKYPQKKDSGIYECQISTTPPIGHFVYMNVVEPKTEVEGGPDMYINEGSTINLTCVVENSPDPAPVINWSHNKETISFDSPRGGISLVTEKGSTTTSKLLIQKAVVKDSGIYACEPFNMTASSVRVHILDGEHQAAMHHAHGSSVSPTIITALITLTVLHWYRMGWI
uniref:Neurotrimin n=3 Tax=Cacopsylla melanoneura TaxID=428564 RepID=A0A8D8T162_9HEMI